MVKNGNPSAPKKNIDKKAVRENRIWIVIFFVIFTAGLFLAVNDTLQSYLPGMPRGIYWAFRLAGAVFLLLGWEGIKQHLRELEELTDG